MRTNDDLHESERRALQAYTNKRAYRRRTLFARLGAALAAAIAARMIRCPRHGYQPTVDACPCVLADGIAYHASPRHVACAIHHLELNSGDRYRELRAAAVFEPTCRACLHAVLAGDDPRLADFRDWLAPPPAA